MKTARIALALSALLAFAACSEDGDGRLPSPSSQLPSESPTTTGGSGPSGVTGPTGSTGATGGTGASGVLPTTSPGAASGNLSSGEVLVELSGDVRIRKMLTNLISAVYSPPPGALALVWAAGGTDATVVGIGGASFTGTRESSPSLSVTLTVQTGSGLASFLSLAGECTVTLDLATEDELAGSFRCEDLVGSAGEVVDVSGSFQASGPASG